jgi:hypothetical protein
MPLALDHDGRGPRRSPITTPTNDDNGPLSAEQSETLRIANESLKERILGAAKVATFNAWSLAVFGSLSVLTGIFSLTGLVVGVGLLAFA